MIGMTRLLNQFREKCLSNLLRNYAFQIKIEFSSSSMINYQLIAKHEEHRNRGIFHSPIYIQCFDLTED